MYIYGVTDGQSADFYGLERRQLGPPAHSNNKPKAQSQTKCCMLSLLYDIMFHSVNVKVVSLKIAEEKNPFGQLVSSCFNI